MQNPAPSPLVGEGRGERPQPQSFPTSGGGAHPSAPPGARPGSSGASAGGRLLVAATFLVVAVALGMVVFYAPNDRVQGVVQRIFYFHVPMAWVAYLAFAVVAVASVAYLWRRDLRWDALARASAELGVLFTTLVLVTGSLWAKPIWNTWWTWDPRLTTAAITELIYIAYFMLRQGIDDPDRRARFSAVYALIGGLSAPITFFAIRLFRMIHPVVIAGSNSEAEGTFSMTPDMLTAFFFALFAFTVIFIDLFWNRIRLENFQDEVEQLKMKVTM